MNNHFSRVVHCARRKERASIVEILTSRTRGIVESVKPLPPGYEQVMHHLAREDTSGTAHIPTNAIDWARFACAHCGQKQIIKCGECGSHFCDSGQNENLACPKCGTWWHKNQLHTPKHVEASTFGVDGEKPEIIRQRQVQAGKRAGSLIKGFKQNRKLLT